MSAVHTNNEPPPMEESMVCLSVVEDGPRIAFAAYNEERNCILLEECYADGYETQGIAERVLATIRPNLLLVSNKIVANDALLEVLTTPPPPEPTEGAQEEEGEEGDLEQQQQQEHEQQQDEGNLGLSRSIRYRLMKSSTFELRNCKSVILKLHVQSLQRRGPTAIAANQPGGPRHFPGQRTFRVSNYHAVASVIDLDSKVQVQAVGSLLSFLESTIFRLQQDGIISVCDVIHTQALLHMTISPDTLGALNIFATEHHPLAVAKGYGNAKEGVSLFSLLDRTNSRIGRQRLREWMLKPLLDVAAISTRQDGVELFCRSELQSAVGTLWEHLKNAGAVDKILNRMQKCCATAQDFLVLAKSLTAGVAIITTLQHDVLGRLQQEYESNPMAVHYLQFCSNILAQCHLASLQDLIDRLDATIDEESTAENGTVVIRRGYNDSLDQWKQQYEQLGDILEECGSSLGQRLPHLKRYLTIMFMPQVGFLAALQHHPSWEKDGALPEDFTFVFTEDDASYYKNVDTRDLDMSIGDIDSYIKDTEALMVSELEEVLLDHESELRTTFNALADLDCILAFASVAVDQKYVRPVVVPAQDNCIRIRNGRHPLQEIIIDGEFIPNDANIDSNNRLNIVTGPNFSGKSCYARQIGILTYMAHLGCFLPCDAAQVSVVNHILARFSAVETCAVPQSSFQLDLTKTGSILRRAGTHSLVIMDEFGKGTSPASGIALLSAALKHLATKGCKVICTTHFLEMFSMYVLTDGHDGIRALRMAVQVPTSSQEQATPLFKLELGVASSSAGLVCAKMAGVKQAVVDRASEIVKATRERRKVQPLPEILRDTLSLSTHTKENIHAFLSTDWTKASDEDIQRFLSGRNSE